MADCCSELATDRSPVSDVRHAPLWVGRYCCEVVQRRVLAFWFRDRELALSFGMTLAVSRLGSVLNFLLTPNLARLLTLRWTLCIGNTSHI